MDLSNCMHSHGKISIYIGPMFAGKTTRMASEVEKYHIANKSCIFVKYSGDTRYDGIAPASILTHSGREFSNIPVIRASTLAEVFEEVNEYDVVGIDEVQFFTDNVEMTRALANNGKLVFCSGLDADFKAEPFGRMAEMVAISEDVEKLKAVCMSCCASASFTRKLTGGECQVEIGSAGMYASVCRKCMYS